MNKQCLFICVNLIAIAMLSVLAIGLTENYRFQKSIQETLERLDTINEPTYRLNEQCDSVLRATYGDYCPVCHREFQK